MKKLLLIASSLEQLIGLKELAENFQEYQCWFRPIFLNTKFFKVKRTWISLLWHKMLHAKEDRLIRDYCNVYRLNIDGQDANVFYDLAISYIGSPVTENFTNTKTVCIQQVYPDSANKKVIDMLKQLLLGVRRFYKNSYFRFEIYCVTSDYNKTQLQEIGISSDRIFIVDESSWVADIANLCRNFLELAMISQMPHFDLKKKRLEYLNALYKL